MRCQQGYRDNTLNKAIGELSSYRDIQKYISHLQEKREEYEERYTSVQSTVFDKIIVTGGEYRDKMAEIAILWADLDLKIKQKQAEAEKTYWKIKDKLETLSVMQARVLELYYVKMYSVVQISGILDYSPEWVKTTKKQGLKKYSKI